MQNYREYNEILSIMKKLIDSNEIKITKDSFSIQNLKNILLTFPQFEQEINSLKEKLKSQNDKNSNWFFMLKLLNKKKGKNSKILINHLNTNFHLMINEPKFIVDLNKNIYNIIINDIKNKQQNYKMISIINGNFSSELFNMKSEFYSNSNFTHLNSQLLLDEMYEVENPNLNMIIKQNDMFLSEWERKHRFKFNLNGYSLDNLKSTYEKYIMNWSLYTEAQVNLKKRRDTFYKLIQENNKMQILELCKDGGIPNSLRKSVYSCLLNINDQFQIKDINQNDHIFIYDYYILRDVHKISSGENYFLFEENLIRLLCLMIRDHNLITEIQGVRPMIILNLSNNNNFQNDNNYTENYNSLKVVPIKKKIDDEESSLTTENNNQQLNPSSSNNNLINDSGSDNNLVIKSTEKKNYDINPTQNICVPFPPSGLFPSPGFAFQMGPFTYMSNNIDDFYLVAKIFYGKYLSFLTSYTSNKKSILSLLSSFDNIFFSMNCFSELKEHFKQKEFDINQIAFYLFMTSFATIVDPPNVFKLYDLIIITDQLGIFVLFALSVVYYLKDELLSANNSDEINLVFENIVYDQCDSLELMKSFLNGD